MLDQCVLRACRSFWGRILLYDGIERSAVKGIMVPFGNAFINVFIIDLFSRIWPTTLMPQLGTHFSLIYAWFSFLKELFHNYHAKYHKSTIPLLIFSFVPVSSALHSFVKSVSEVYAIACRSNVNKFKELETWNISSYNMHADVHFFFFFFFFFGGGGGLPEKGDFCNPTLSGITCSRIRTTEPKWLILVSFFRRR